ncbi:MAG: hypothetical protein U0L85_02030 [Bacilli bacterium]|nr:hypothetical protein [Bacilli bacterium]
MDKFKIKFDKDKIKSKVDELGEATKKVLNETSEKATEGKEVLKEQYSKVKHELDKARLAPVFKEDLLEVNYKQPAVLRIVDYDKRLENEVCFGSIGFEEKAKTDNILHFYTSYASESRMSFYPYLEETIYCADPYKENYYISLDEYFAYLKKAKINELEKIAYVLGAKHVKISIKEKKKTLITHTSKSKLSVKGGPIGKSSSGYESSSHSDEYAEIKIESNTSFEGHDNPVMPEVVYFKYDNDIKALIEMRMNDKNALKTKTYSLDYTTGRDMHEKTAANLDALLKKIGCTGNKTVTNEVEDQKRFSFEYTIEF